MPDDTNWDDDTTATDLASLPDGAQPQRDRACLTVLTGSAAGQVFRLQRGTSTIGRSGNVEIRIPDDGVSRQHARLRQDSRNLYLDDLDSRNGTFVNGQRVTAGALLREGDKIQIGRSTVLRYAVQDELDESFHESLVSSALRDPLTKLFNKRYLLDRLDSELKFARRHETWLTLMMIDIDHFKLINDTHGHLAGDAVLVHFANVLQHSVRNEDVVSRWGGEELAIVLRATPIDPAVALGERLRKLVEQTLVVHKGHQLRATISIGVAGFPQAKVETVEQLVEAADQALYRAKNAGRNRVAR